MQKIMNTLYALSHSLIQYISLLLTGLLLFSSLVCTAYSIDMDSQKVLYIWDNPFYTILGSGLMGLAFYILSQKFTTGKTGRQRLLRILVLTWYVGCNLILFAFSKTAPSGDCYSVYSLAMSLAADNTTVIHPVESYISYYPQQIGLVAFWETLIRLWNLVPIELHAYHFIKIVNMILGCAIILFQEKIVHLLWNNQKAESLYLVIAAANCPLLLYTSFLYGEIPSYAALCGSLYLLLRVLVDKGTVWHSITSILLLTLSVMLRKNALIFVIAILIVVLLWALKQKRYSLLALAALFCVCTLTVLPLAESYYEHRSGNTISSGVTATSYFAMGMQESSRAHGWYNGFNFETYRDSGMNTVLANKRSQDAILERLAYFKEHPGYTAIFYLEKYLSQWTDGSYACRQATLATFGGRKDFFVSLYEGKGSHYLIAYCNFYQNLIYLGAFAYCLSALRKKRENTSDDSIGYSLPAFIGLIAVLGGFLFHMMWEANSRYIFLYGLTLLPFAAKGLDTVSDWLAGCSSKFNKFFTTPSSGDSTKISRKAR